MGDERNPIAKVPFYVAEIKRQQRERDQKAVERLLEDTAKEARGGQPNEPGEGRND